MVHPQPNARRTNFRAEGRVTAEGGLFLRDAADQFHRSGPFDPLGKVRAWREPRLTGVAHATEIGLHYHSCLAHIGFGPEELAGGRGGGRLGEDVRPGRACWTRRLRPRLERGWIRNVRDHAERPVQDWVAGSLGLANSMTPSPPVPSDESSWVNFVHAGR